MYVNRFIRENNITDAAVIERLRAFSYGPADCEPSSWDRWSSQLAIENDFWVTMRDASGEYVGCPVCREEVSPYRGGEEDPRGLYCFACDVAGY